MEHFLKHFWPDQMLVLIRTLAILSGLAFGIAEVRTKKKHLTAIIISAGLALSAQIAEWGVGAYRQHSEQRIFSELARSRYPLTGFRTVIEVEIPSDDSDMGPYKEVWNRFFADVAQKPQLWKEDKYRPDAFRLVDKTAHAVIEMNQKKELRYFAIEDGSHLLFDPSPPADDDWQDIGSTVVKPIFQVGFTRNLSQALQILKDDSIIDSSAFDLEVTTCSVLSGCSYRVEYLADASKVRVMASDDSWVVTHETGSITSFVDLPGYELLIIAPFKNMVVTDAYFITPGALSRCLYLHKEDFEKVIIGGIAIFHHKIEQADLGILADLNKNKTH